MTSLTHRNDSEASDIRWMQIALSLAQTAQALDEVPVGAVIVKDQMIIGTGFNLRERYQSVLGHAELEAISQANAYLNSWRLIDCTLYVTLEPCIMCAGALYQTRIGRIVYGTKDPKGGAIGSLFDIANDQRLNHRMAVTDGILEHECADLLKNFFRKKRMNHSIR